MPEKSEMLLPPDQMQLTFFLNHDGTFTLRQLHHFAAGMPEDYAMLYRDILDGIACMLYADPGEFARVVHRTRAGMMALEKAARAVDPETGEFEADEKAEESPKEEKTEGVIDFASRKNKLH